jgi:serine/threonine protein kinase
MTDPTAPGTPTVSAVPLPVPARPSVAPATTVGGEGGPTPQPRTIDFEPPPEAPTAPNLPAVPGFAIERELGRGGMGVVYLARQMQLNRPVALKMILRGEFASPAAFERFAAEAQIVAKLQHPHIVLIHEAHTTGTTPYFALEYLDGGSLDRKLREKPLTPTEAAALVEKLACGVQYAHEHGVIHRDLKPHNILLTKNGEPKVTDFGLAKQADVDLTASYAQMGTPNYMAPEQAEGKTSAIGPAADIYALGAILYECLTGRPPFRGASVAEVLDLVRRTEPVAVRALQPTVPKDLETICHKCLQKEPAKRYATAAALADDLQRFREDRPILARPAGRGERAWRWCRRNPLVASLTAGVAAALLIGTAVSIGLAVWALGNEAKAVKAAGEER